MKSSVAFLGIALICSTSEASQPCGMEDLVSTSFETLLDTATVYSSNKIPTCISQAPSTISSYSYKEIQSLGSRTLSDLLSLVAGVQMQTVPNGRHRLWMRGVQAELNNKIALYIDGVPIKDAFGGFPIDEEFSIESVEKIEIIRGPGSALYGGSAFSGVINISTFQAGSKAGKHTQNILKLGIGENNTHLAYATAEQNIADVVDVKLEGKWLDTDGRKPKYNREGQVNTRSNEQELASLRISLSALGGDLRFNGFYSQFDNDRVDKPLPLQNRVTDKKMRFSLSYKHQFSDDFGVDINAYHTETKRLEHEVTYTKSNLLDDDRRYISHTTLSGVYSAINYRPVKSNQIVTGFEIKREAEPTSGYVNLLTDEFSNSTIEPGYQNLALMTYSVFWQDTQDIFSKNTQFTAGVRFDALDLFQNQFNYRLGLTHDFENGFSTKLLYGTAYRAPSFVEFTRSRAVDPVPTVEKMKTLEAQIGYQNKNLQLSLTGYRNSYKDLIQRANSFNTNSYTVGIDSGVFGNFDRQTIVGAEFEAQVSFDEHWKSFVNASYSHAKSYDATQKLPLLADWTVAAGLEWKEKVYSGDLIFNNQVVVYGKRKDWQDDLWLSGQQQRRPNRSSSFTDGYAVWNSSLHYKIPFANNKQLLDFNLTAHNLLNKKYYTQSLDSPSAAKGDIANFDAQYQGRQVRFSVSYSWE
jgi:outer membrane cobalamin receptor